MSAVLSSLAYSPQSTVVRVTPQEARRMLETNVNNRPMNKSHVRRLAEQMAAGAWQVNGETIKLDTSGRLIDGQHRLAAVVQSGCEVDMEIRYNVPTQSFATLDTGRVRKGADALAISGYADPNNLAATARIVFAWERSGSLNYYAVGARGATNADVVETMKKHPRIADSLTAVTDLNMRRFYTISMAAALHYMLHLKHPNDPRVNEFWQRLADGIGLPAGHPILTLRERLISAENRSTAFAKMQIAAFTVKAWNAFLEGAELHRMRFATNEDFPGIK